MKSVYAGKGLPCPKCNKQMHTKRHPQITQKELNKLYYYSQWDVCNDCRHLQHYEEYKVYNKNMQIYINSKEQENNLLDLMRNF